MRCSINFICTRLRFGAGAGLAAGLAFLLNPSVAKHSALVRSDALFALIVMLAALAAWRAWTRTRNWIPFWLAAAAATLTKGPLGVVLAASGLLAFFMYRRSDLSAPRPKGSHWKGLALYVLLCFGWFAAAFYQTGGDLVERMILQELLGHSAGIGRSSFPLSNLPRPFLFFLTRFLPVSVPAVIGLWRVLKHPAEDPEKRLFERFLFCWFMCGLILFSLATHHRADLLLPLWPAAALLAGRELIRFRNGCRTVRLADVLFVLTCAVVIAICIWNSRVSSERRSTAISRSVEVTQAAEAFRQSGLPAEDLVHLNTPVTFQMILGTHRKWSSPVEIRTRLEREGSILLALDRSEKSSSFGPAVQGFSVQPVFYWPPEEESTARMIVFRVSGNGGDVPPETVSPSGM